MLVCVRPSADVIIMKLLNVSERLLLLIDFLLFLGPR